MFYVYNKETKEVQGIYKKRPIAITDNLDCIEYGEVRTPSDYTVLMVENGKVILDVNTKTKEQEKLSEEIAKCKDYLNKTDYIALKLAEADENKREALKQTYKSELEKREECRSNINKLESELKAIV